MLNWNANKVKNLTGSEIWMFIAARLLIGFGAGALFALYYPSVAFPVAIAAVVVGLMFFIFAFKGFNRQR